MARQFHIKPNMYVSHIQLKVSDLARSIEYYKNVIGFKVLEQTNNTAYLTADGKTSIVSLLQIENPIPLRRDQTGLYHMALLIPSKKDFGNMLKHLIDLDIGFGAGDHHVSEAIYMQDPDGNGIEIYIDRPEDTWIWQNEFVFMTVEEVNIEDVLDAADGNWLGLPQNTVIGHIHLSVADIDTARDFYTNVLDYKVVYEYHNKAIFVSTGNYHHHLAFNIWNSKNGLSAPANAVGLKSLTIVLRDEVYAQEVKSRLKVAGYSVKMYGDEPKYGGTQSFSTVDANGFPILFTVEGV